ncbi:hypothetical protein RND81_12G159900 [Saponaria officinalis]|uniref:NAC domain-containing protein n=1 Tax=Saponaria officinalis TaxID=3572 RepID=A0AAW1HB94_SAPOF
MDVLLERKSNPPGFRFHPTDEELFMFYLKRKVIGKSIPPQMMSELDVYRFDPWDLPAKACAKTRDLNWYFLCPRSKKYPSRGKTATRVTVHGYWKSTGVDKTVNYNNRPVGKIKTLVFYRGKAPKGDRTDWVMYEYRLEDRLLSEQRVTQDSYVICKIHEKSGPGSKCNAAFVEEEWDSDNDKDDNLEDRGFVLHPDRCIVASTLDTRMLQQPVSVDVTCNRDVSVLDTTLADHRSRSPSTPATVQQPACTAMGGLPVPPIETEEDELDRLLTIFTEDDGNLIPESKVFNALEDLTGGKLSPHAEFDWSQFLSDDYYLELDDLHFQGPKG